MMLRLLDMQMYELGSKLILNNQKDILLYKDMNKGVRAFMACLIVIYFAEF